MGTLHRESDSTSAGGSQFVRLRNTYIGQHGHPFPYRYLCLGQRVSEPCYKLLDAQGYNMVDMSCSAATSETRLGAPKMHPHNDVGSSCKTGLVSYVVLIQWLGCVVRHCTSK